jgi:hypothetical protein
MRRYSGPALRSGRWLSLRIPRLIGLRACPASLMWPAPGVRSPRGALGGCAPPATKGVTRRAGLSSIASSRLRPGKPVAHARCGFLHLVWLARGRLARRPALQHLNTKQRPTQFNHTKEERLIATVG